MCNTPAARTALKYVVPGSSKFLHSRFPFQNLNFWGSHPIAMWKKKKNQECSESASAREDFPGCRKAPVVSRKYFWIFCLGCDVAQRFRLFFSWSFAVPSLLSSCICCSQLLRKWIEVNVCGFFMMCKKKNPLIVTPCLRCSGVQLLWLKKGTGCDCVSLSLKVLWKCQ